MDLTRLSKAKLIELVQEHRDTTNKHSESDQWIENSESNLQATVQRLQKALAVAQLGYWERNVATNELVWSDEMYAIYERPKERGMLTPEEEQEYYHFQNLKTIQKSIEKALVTKQPIQFDYKIHFPKGHTKDILAHVNPILDDSGTVVHLVGTVQDITNHKRIETSIRQTLSEKKVLLKEVQHRVKNNLTIIISLMFLQLAKAENEETVRQLTEIKNRVFSMALNHNLLDDSSSIMQIDFVDYINRLVSHISSVFETMTPRINIHLDLQPINMDLNRAIPCWLFRDPASFS